MLLPNCFVFLFFYFGAPITIRIYVAQLFNNYLVLCILSPAIADSKYKCESYCNTICYQYHNNYVCQFHKNLSYFLGFYTKNTLRITPARAPAKNPNTNVIVHILKPFPYKLFYLLFSLFMSPLHPAPPSEITVTASAHWLNDSL